MNYECENCGKIIDNMDDYNKETEDIGNSWEWLVVHKGEFCKKDRSTCETIR